MTTENLSIEPAKLADIDQLIKLHNKYLLNNLTQEQIRKGFIKVTYDHDNFISIIRDNAIVIVKDKDTIIGYYLLGHSSNAPSLKYQFEALKNCSIDDKLLSELNVGCGAQAILEKEYRGNNLIKKMLQKLIEQIKLKYNFLFSSITKANENAFKVHKNSGYIIVGEDETKYFVCLKLNEQ